jgi:hypothetical protein
VISDGNEAVESENTLAINSQLETGINGALSRLDATETKLLPGKWLPAETGRCYTNVCRCKLKVRPRAEISTQFICMFTVPYYYLKLLYRLSISVTTTLYQQRERERETEIRTAFLLCKFWIFVTYH